MSLAGVVLLVIFVLECGVLGSVKFPLAFSRGLASGEKRKCRLCLCLVSLVSMIVFFWCFIFCVIFVCICVCFISPLSRCDLIWWLVG